MTAALAIPDPADASVPALIDACLAARVWADDCHDLSAALEVLARVAAIESYLTKRGQQQSAQEAGRWLEVRIGELLGPGEPTAGPGRGKPSTANDGLSRDDRLHFRQLAAHRAIVAELVPCSRRLVLKTIKQRSAADKPEPADINARFPTIVIDPPWRYGNTSTRGAAEDHYPTMTQPQLAELKIPATDNAHLYLWVTNSFLNDGLDLLALWGFTYKTILTWCKPSIGMGNYFRNNIEHVLFGVRGQLGTNANNIGTWFAANKTRHSAKPQSFYDIVEASSPGPYLEMFARTRRLGDWSTWGNEA